MDCDQNDLTKHSNYTETLTFPFILNEQSKKRLPMTFSAKEE